jgi:CHAT domain-containing protein
MSGENPMLPGSGDLDGGLLQRTASGLWRSPEQRPQPPWLQITKPQMETENQRLLKEFLALQEEVQKSQAQIIGVKAELADLQSRAYQSLTEQAADAYDLFGKAVEKEDEILHQLSVVRSREEQMNALMRELFLPEKAWLLWGMGQAALQLGRLTKAREKFQEALSVLAERRNPLTPLLREALADVLLAQGRYSEAERCYDEAQEECAAGGQWDTAVLALSSAADCALFQGDRANFSCRLKDAIDLARAHELSAIETELRLKDLRFRLYSDPTGEVEDELDRMLSDLSQEPALGTDKFRLSLILADLRCELGAWDGAERTLRERASRLAGSHPLRQLDVAERLAALCEARGKLRDAMSYAEDALNIAEGLSAPSLTRGVLVRLIPLLTESGDPGAHARASEQMAKLRNMDPSSELAQVLLARGLVYWKKKDYESAQNDVKEAEGAAKSLGLQDLRRTAVIARTAVLEAKGDIKQALDANQQAIELCKEQFLPLGTPPVTGWSDLLGDFEALHGNAASLMAQLGRVREAFEMAENGKARRLVSELVQAGLTHGDSPAEIVPLSLEEVRSVLLEARAAMALYWVGFGRTVVLVVDPQVPEPEAFSIKLGMKNLKDSLASAETDGWTDNSLNELSEKLLPPRLQEVARRHPVLYVVPDSHLYFVPFAALPVDHGSPLIECCALAYVPSAATLKWCRARSFQPEKRACLAVGAGVDKEQKPPISFAKQAQEVKELWGSQSKCLPEVTAEEFWKDAPRYTVLHISCHGILDESVPATLSASQLKFKDRTLSAKEIFEHKGELCAELVFLNACRSGRFRLRLAGEIGGFWEAFLHAGAASLISALTKVDPDPAHELAMDFYRRWLKKDTTKAQALQGAQLQLRKRYPALRHWASHVLIGDHH